MGIAASNPTWRGRRRRADLLNERWLRAIRTRVAMESTGIYWRPVYNLLEEAGLELMVVNARHMKAVPGKTDARTRSGSPTARHGLLRPSFIPSRAERGSRDLTRYRRTQIEARVHQVQRLQKVLEGANVELEDVISDALGLVFGR